MKRNRIVVIQSKSAGTDVYGGITDVWADVASVWAAKLPLNSRDLLVAQSAKSSMTVRFNIQYPIGFTVTDKMRIVEGGKYYDIIGDPIDKEDAHKELDIMTTTGVSLG